MAEWIVGPVMEKIIAASFEYLKDRSTGIEEELQRLRDIQPKIQAVISAYSEIEIKDPALNKWYWQLRDAIDEADDVLDDFDYMKHKKQVSKTKKIRKVRSIMKKIGKRALKIDPNLKRLEVAVQKLDRVSAEVNSFRNLLEGRKQKQEQEQLDLLQTRETGSMPANVLLGRSKEMESVKQWVCTETYEIDNNDLYRNISLLSVVGHGGMGKTTLLQHVYEDIRMTKEFDVHMWVCVSNNFDVKTVTKNILESLQNQKTNLDSLDMLQRSLQSQVTSKRFLLVLDDIWENNETKWENVLRPLRYGNLGSKILITTRMGSVASNISMIKNTKTFPLEGLKENECLELFNTHAFSIENPNESLKSIAGDIVKKISGCPLAAKMIGSSLKSEDESYWRRVLNTNVGVLEVGENGLLPILKLSYTFLPKLLQICFAFCCIFPQDHLFDKDDLVKMWVALGFIQPSNFLGETLEDIGRRYFNILVQKSFFDEFHFPFNSDHKFKVYYKMHDLLHDLAQSVSKQECFRLVENKELPIPNTIRHLSIDTLGLKAYKNIGEFKSLRSLFLSYDANYDEDFVSVLSKIFEASKNIRLLYIYAQQQKEISEKISCLTHLRYFNLTSKIVQFPRSISQLYHLQCIIYQQGLNNHYVGDLLPKDINNLYNLRYLSIPFQAYDKIYEIRKLKSLQELECFKVKNEIGYGIGELEHMNELRLIRIHKLETIKNPDEACKAKFYDKKNLTDLSLCWGTHTWAGRENTVDHDLDEKVLDSIQPYNNLKRLCINAYMGVKSGIWMSNVYLISNLEYITLSRCLEWQTLPPFGQLRFLKRLKLYDMPKVEQINHNKDCMFPSLEKLFIENAEALQTWFDATEATENGSFLPCLVKMHLKNCPRLQELPSYPTKLRDLYLDNIGWRGCHWLPAGIRNCFSFEIRNCPNLFRLKTVNKELKNNENCEHIMDELVISDPSVLLMEPLTSISSLCELTIEENDELVSFPSEIEQWFLQLSSSLFKLEFNNLQSLQPLPSLKSFSSLNHLSLRKIPLLKSLSDLPSSLTFLLLSNIPLLESLTGLPFSLTFLSLSNIPLLKSLSDLPSSLKYLSIEELESLMCLPSSLSTISSLTYLELRNIPLLESLPDLPSSLKYLEIEKLESLHSLPSSLSTISSLIELRLTNIPLLESLPDLPPSLRDLHLENLEDLRSVPTLPTLDELRIIEVPRLLKLPHLTASLYYLSIENCDPQLMERYPNFDKRSM